jgi:hypothetical protein
MTPDIQMKNDVAIAIQSFETTYRRRTADAALEEVDTVTFIPLGDSKTVLQREIRRLQMVRSLEDCGDNISALVAHRTWEAIRPAYEHWKRTNTLPESGTPLAAWPGVTRSQADLLRNCGLRSVEDVAGATDTVMSKTGLPEAGNLVALAKRFIDAGKQASEAAKAVDLQAQNAELREQMKEMQELMAGLVAAKDGDQGKGRKAREAA